MNSSVSLHALWELGSMHKDSDSVAFILLQITVVYGDPV